MNTKMAPRTPHDDPSLPPPFLLRIGDLMECHVVMAHCYACNHEGELWPKRLQRRCKRDERLVEIARRFKCTECGNRHNNWARVLRLPR